MIEWMSDDEEGGLAYHMEKEAYNTLEFTLQNFSGVARQRKHLSYASNF
jgi:hypothetical protein